MGYPTTATGFNGYSSPATPYEAQASAVPERTTVNTLLAGIFQRVAGLVNDTGDLAYFLRGPQSTQTGSNVDKESGDPSLIQRLQAIHQLLNMAERHISDINLAVR